MFIKRNSSDSKTLVALTRRRAAFTAACVAVCGMADTSQGASWVLPQESGPGDWFTASNWSPAIVPTFGSAEINNGGTSEIASGTITNLRLNLGSLAGN